MSTGMRVGAGGLAALCAGALCIPLLLGAGKPNGGGWDDACTSGSTTIEVAADKQTVPPVAPGAQVTVPLNPQGKQNTPSWSASQQRWAGIITNVARSRGLPPRAAVIGVATAMQESTLENINFGDRDSLGLFQQRPSMGWGTPAQVTDAVYASNTFYKHLEKIEDWQTKPLTKVAQAVQRSGFPDAYAKWEQSAGELVVKSWGNAVLTTTSGCDPAQSAVGKGTGAWALPVENSRITTPYKAGGGMWSSGSHTGVDFSVPTGTRIQAVGTGTVVKAGWGGAYGNEVVIKMSDGKYTQYAHLSSIAVTQGQAVTARQQIGVSGATGNVTGPHLHFETRTGPAYGSDISPVDYLRSHGLSL
ncbi:M23 family metallopeptidase [Streptomyces sp. NPDC048272]|uniref:M23 family metallopeptidase n=1 Tax=Streptomyces sp. NPDC048272 TaxID=3154616 RepID=UPI00341682E4